MMRMSIGKTIRFPHRHSIGSLYVAHETQPDEYELLNQVRGLVTTPENQPINWEWLDEARGKINVPPNHKLKLKISSAVATSLAPLAQLDPDSLHVLDLSRTRVTDRAMSNIAHLSGLKILELGYTNVSDEGLSEIRGLSQLLSLGLTRSCITDEGLAAVGRLTGLRELWLNGCNITDEGVAQLKQLTQMIQLGLSSTAITDGALLNFENLKEMLRLYLFSTQVSEEGVKSLADKLSKCRIKWKRQNHARPDFRAFEEEDDNVDLDEDFDWSVDLTSADTPSEPDTMTEARFWEIIDLLDWDKEGDDSAIIEPAVSALAKLSQSDIYLFKEILNEKLYKLDTKGFAKEIGKDAYKGSADYFSKDWFLQARCCVIANGREFFDEVVSNATNMPKDLGFPALLNIAARAYKRKTGKNLVYVTKYSCETFSNENGWSEHES